MSRITKLVAKPAKKEIRGEQWEVIPLKVKDLELAAILESGKPPEKAKALRQMVWMMVKHNDATITPEEFNNMGMEAFQDFLEVILEVNGFDVAGSVKDLAGQEEEQQV